ncbi:hypothetical protein CK203_048276 [Vitis vinifera]|uniref:Uncharacterized protein n=1 Tax=Vitis vinifera TaxID=29760 RepID=A0A438H0U2_VITVI|nr:hypothetical protein CK203_048276 [Vitis vinifera]
MLCEIDQGIGPVRPDIRSERYGFTDSYQSISFAEVMASIQEAIASLESLLGKDFDGAPVGQFTRPSFRMLEIERYTGIGCPRIHLRLYSTIMRAHGLERGSDDYAFPHVSRWRYIALIAEIIDQTFRARSDTDGLEEFYSPGSPGMWSGYRSQILGHWLWLCNDVEDGISRGLWTDSSPSDIKGKKAFVGSRPADVSTIGSSSQRLLMRHQPIPQFPEPHSSYASHQYRPQAPRPAYDQTYTPQTLALPYYASQGIERPSVSYTATGQPCYATQFTARPAAPFSPTQSSTDFCSLCFEDTEAILTDRHAVEPGSSEAYRGWVIDYSHPSSTAQPIPP